MSKRCATLPNNPLTPFQQGSFDCGPTAAPWPYLKAKRQPCLGVTQATLRVRHSASRPRGKRTAPPGDTRQHQERPDPRTPHALFQPRCCRLLHRDQVSQMRSLELQDGQKVSPTRQPSLSWTVSWSAELDWSHSLIGRTGNLSFGTTSATGICLSKWASTVHCQA